MERHFGFRNWFIGVGTAVMATGKRFIWIRLQPPNKAAFAWTSAVGFYRE